MTKNLPEDDKPFILKTRRIEYLLEKTKQIQQDLWEKNGIDYNQEFVGVSLSERADIDFVNDLRFWSAKYY